MKYLKYICLVYALFSTISLCAKEFTEKLKSQTNDIVTITYNVVVNDGNVSVSFGKLRKQLGLGNNEKYDDPSKIKLLFFDKNGGLQGDVFNSKISTEALTINRDEMSYSRSEEGYVWLDDQPELHLKLYAREAKLSIPVYIAYYRKKHTYDIIAYCGNLNIPLSQQPHQGQSHELQSQKPSMKTITEQEVIEGELSPSELALELIEKVNEILQQNTGTTLPGYFDTYTSELRRIELNISDARLKQQIKEVLERAEEKRIELEQSSSLANQQAAEEATIVSLENDVRANLEYLNDRLGKKDELSESDMAKLKDLADELRRKSHSVKDSVLAEQMNRAADQCDEQMQKIENAKKKKNLWMIIGGILLAILMFVGNQVFQHFRNIRSQKGIAEMQEKMVKRAENDARRRARNAINSKVNQIQNAAIDKSRQTVRGGVKKGVNSLTKGKDNKGITI